MLLVSISQAFVTLTHLVIHISGPLLTRLTYLVFIILGILEFRISFISSI